MKFKTEKNKPKLIVADVPVRAKGKMILFKAVRNDIPSEKGILAFYKAHKKKNNFDAEYVPIDKMDKALLRPLLSAWMRREFRMTISSKGGVDAFRPLLSHEVEQIKKEKEQEENRMGAFKDLDKRERRRLENGN